MEKYRFRSDAYLLDGYLVDIIAKWVNTNRAHTFLFPLVVRGWAKEWFPFKALHSPVLTNKSNWEDRFQSLDCRYILWNISSPWNNIILAIKHTFQSFYYFPNDADLFYFSIKNKRIRSGELGLFLTLMQSIVFKLYFRSLGAFTSEFLRNKSRLRSLFYGTHSRSINSKSRPFRLWIRAARLRRFKTYQWKYWSGWRSRHLIGGS